MGEVSALPVDTKQPPWRNAAQKLYLHAERRERLRPNLWRLQRAAHGRPAAKHFSIVWSKPLETTIQWIRPCARPETHHAHVTHPQATPICAKIAYDMQGNHRSGTTHTVDAAQSACVLQPTFQRLCGSKTWGTTGTGFIEGVKGTLPPQALAKRGINQPTTVLLICCPSSL